VVIFRYERATHEGDTRYKENVIHGIIKRARMSATAHHQLLQQLLSVVCAPTYSVWFSMMHHLCFVAKVALARKQILEIRDLGSIFKILE
jgi:hypothetical protein